MLAESIDAKVCRALIELFSTDAGFFAATYPRGVRYMPPRIPSSMFATPGFISLPEFFVQNIISRDAFNRKTGGFAKPTVNVQLSLWKPDDKDEYQDIADPNKIINEIVALEQLLERGSLGQLGENTAQGKLIDPDSTYGDPAVVRYLNTESPNWQRVDPLRIDISSDRDQSTIALVYPVIVSYVITENRLTRRQQ